MSPSNPKTPTPAQQVERYCPSGHYPTPVLFHEGRELRLPEAVTRLVEGLRDARQRVRALERIVPTRRGVSLLGGWVGGVFVGVVGAPRRAGG